MNVRIKASLWLIFFITILRTPSAEAIGVRLYGQGSLVSTSYVSSSNEEIPGDSGQSFRGGLLVELFSSKRTRLELGVSYGKLSFKQPLTSTGTADSYSTAVISAPLLFELLLDKNDKVGLLLYSETFYPQGLDEFKNSKLTATFFSVIGAGLRWKPKLGRRDRFFFDALYSRTFYGSEGVKFQLITLGVGLRLWGGKK